MCAVPQEPRVRPLRSLLWPLACGPCFAIRPARASSRRLHPHQTSLESFLIRREREGSSALIDVNAYRASRTKDVDDDEALNWNPQLISLLSSPFETVDIAQSLETAIRRGIPDHLKRAVLLKAHGTESFISSTPEFYAMKLREAFGKRVPVEFDNHVPTFAGGFLGIEEELVQAPFETGDSSKQHFEMFFDLPIHQVSFIDYLASDASDSTLSSAFFDDPNGIGLEARGSLPVLNPPFGSSLLVSSPDYRNAQTSVQLFSGNLHPQGTQLLQSPVKPDSRLLRRRPQQPQTDVKSSVLASAPRGCSNAPRDASAANGHSCGPVAACPTGDGNSENLLLIPSPIGRRMPMPLPLLSPESDFDPPVSLPRYEGSNSDNYKEVATDVSSFRLRLEPDCLASRPTTNRQLEIARNIHEPIYQLEFTTHLHHLLTPVGINAAKRILWMLSVAHPAMEFCPVIPNLVCVCLLYLNEEETFLLLFRFVAAASEQREGSFSSDRQMPFIFIRRSEYIRFVKLMVDVASQHLSKVVSKLESLGIDVTAWLASSMANGLARSLPFNALLRVYCSMIFEGTVVIQRYCLAILKVNAARIQKCSSRLRAEFILKSYRKLGAGEIEALSKAAFAFTFRPHHSNIRSYSSYNLPTPYLTEVRLRRFYRPRLHEHSTILQDTDWEFLWPWLPHSVRILDPSLAWTSARHGQSLTALNNATSPSHKQPMLYFIETTRGEVIGGFSRRTFTFDRTLMNKVDPTDSFVFQLRPARLAYEWTGANHIFIRSSPSFLSIGAENAAISVDPDILHGICGESQSFDCPRLAGDPETGDFVIRCMEVWTVK